MKTAKYNYKFPRLTKEEFIFFKKRDKDFFKRFNLNRSLKKKIASSLHLLAIAKMIGIYEFKVDKDKAIKHHLKACKYNPCLACSRPAFRKRAGLLVYECCE